MVGLAVNSSNVVYIMGLIRPNEPGDTADGTAFGSWLNGPFGTSLAARRILTGPTIQYIVYWMVSIGHPARSPLIRLTTRRFEIAERGDIDCVSNYLSMFQAKSSMEWVVYYAAHLFAERRVPPGAIFREKIEG